MKITIGPLGLLALVFVTLKLCGVIAWSWLWVLSPLWLPFAAVAAVLALLSALAMIEAMVAGLKR